MTSPPRPARPSPRTDPPATARRPSTPADDEARRYLLTPSPRPAPLSFEARLADLEGRFAELERTAALSEARRLDDTSRLSALRVELAALHQDNVTSLAAIRRATENVTEQFRAANAERAQSDADVRAEMHAMKHSLAGIDQWRLMQSQYNIDNHAAHVAEGREQRRRVSWVQIAKGMLVGTGALALMTLAVRLAELLR